MKWTQDKANLHLTKCKCKTERPTLDLFFVKSLKNEVNEQASPCAVMLQNKNQLTKKTKILHHRSEIACLKVHMQREVSVIQTVDSKV